MSVSKSSSLILVEDDVAIQEMLRQFFSTREFTVTVFGDAESALRACETTENSFDLAICDLRLPGIDGLALMEGLLKKYPRIPVILITAFGGPESASLALNRGAFDYIEKPLDLVELGVVADRALRISNWKNGPRNCRRIHDSFPDHPTLAALEREYIQYVLQSVEYRKERAAKILGIDRKTLYRKEKEFSSS